jgi:hypothetical protein
MYRTPRNLRWLLEQVYSSYVLVHPYFCRVDFEDLLKFTLLGVRHLTQRI